MLARTWKGIKLSHLARALAGAAPWLPAVAWMAAISYLSHQSAPLGRAASTGEATVAHLVVFGILGLLLLLPATRGAAPGPDFWVLPFFALGLAVLFGFIDELHQTYVPGRTASEVDIALDAAGAALAVAVETAAVLARRGHRGRSDR